MSCKRPPRYALHKASGQARVRIRGKDLYLGVYGSRARREKCARLIAEWLDEHNEPRYRSMLTVEQLAMAYLNHAKVYYVKSGEATDQIHKIRAALRALIHQHRGEAVSDFSPRKLKRLQQVLVDRGLSRTYINDLIGVIKRCLKGQARRKRKAALQEKLLGALCRN